MKKLYLVLSLVLIGAIAQSQNVFNKGGYALNAGIGLLSGNGFIPSLNISGEVGIFPTGDVGLLSVGGILAYKYSTYTYSWWNQNYNYHQMVIGPRAIWHLQTFESKKWDAYAGIGFGLRTWSEYVLNNDLSDLERTARVSPYGEAFVGGRMMLKDKFGLFAELGYGTLSSIKFGATFMLK
ncbi:MAG: hypothetical protein GXO88_02175 [Chlorobi bacterium]|nr:hypothetical protein [Chlorobiota bacterium]